MGTVSPTGSISNFRPCGINTLDYKRRNFIPNAPTNVVRLLGHSSVQVSKGRYIIVNEDGVINGPVTRLLLTRGKAIAVTRSRAMGLGRIAGHTSVLIITVNGQRVVSTRCIGPNTTIVSINVRESRTGRLYNSMSCRDMFPITSTVAPIPNNINPVAVTVLVGGYVRDEEEHL